MKKMKFVVLFVLLVFATSASVASAALVSQYTFDDGTYNDYVGGHNGTAMGNAHIDTGHLDLDNRTIGGVTPPASYVDCGDNPAYFDIANAITLSAWVLPDVAYAAAKDMPFVQNGDEVGIKLKKDDTLEVYIHAATTLAWYVANIPKTQVDVIWADGLFHLVTGTYDSAVGGLNLYVDGVLKSANTTVPVGTLINLTTDSVRIGGDSKATHETRLYTGLIDDVRIYNNALTAEEVRALVPEPATIALLGLGGLALLRRKR